MFYLIEESAILDWRMAPNFHFTLQRRLPAQHVGANPACPIDFPGMLSPFGIPQTRPAAAVVYCLLAFPASIN